MHHTFGTEDKEVMRSSEGTRALYKLLAVHLTWIDRLLFFHKYGKTSRTRELSIIYEIVIKVFTNAWKNKMQKRWGKFTFIIKQFYYTSRKISFKINNWSAIFFFSFTLLFVILDKPFRDKDTSVKESFCRESQKRVFMPTEFLSFFLMSNRKLKTVRLFCSTSYQQIWQKVLLSGHFSKDDSFDPKLHTEATLICCSTFFMPFYSL